VAADDGVGARRVDDADLPKHIGGMSALEQIRLPELIGDLGGVTEYIDPIGGRGHAFGQHPLTEKRVNEARLSRVELPGNHQQKQPAQLLPRLIEAAKVVGGDIGPKALQCGSEPLQQLLFPGTQLLFALRENAFAGQQLTNHHDLRA
jgi:hypothetical protein